MVVVAPGSTTFAKEMAIRKRIANMYPLSLQLLIHNISCKFKFILTINHGRLIADLTDKNIIRTHFSLGEPTQLKCGLKKPTKMPSRIRTLVVRIMILKYSIYY